MESKDWTIKWRFSDQETLGKVLRMSKRFYILRFKISLTLDDSVNGERKVNEINEVKEPRQQGAG